jgi:hypothetical protein
VRSDQWLARWAFLEKAGDRWWPVLGSVYLVTAVKRVRGMRLIGLVKNREKERRVAFAPAASRVPTGEAFSIDIGRTEEAANDRARSAAR